MERGAEVGARQRGPENAAALEDRSRLIALLSFSMDSFLPFPHSSSLISPCSPPSQDDSISSLPSGDYSRRTTHARDRGGLVYGVGVVWTHLRPFLPFFLISCLVVVLVHLMRVIIYSGPFTDPLFFKKFHQRWPRPHSPQSQTLQPDLGSNMTQ